MRSATTATGRPLPSPGKTLPKNRPAPLSCRATHQPAAPKPHVTSQLQCYIPAPASTRHSSRVASHDEINRQQNGSSRSRITTPRHLAPLVTVGRRHLLATSHSSLATAFFPTRRISNRHTSRLESAISHRKQTRGTRSNRHFVQGSASHQRRTANASRPPPVATNIVSNRQWQILEITVNLSKQTIAPRSNRYKNALFASPVSEVRWTPPECCQRTRMGSRDAFPASPTRSRNKGSRVMHHESRAAAHQSSSAVLRSRATGRDSQQLPQSNSLRGALCSAPTRPTSISACA